MSHPWLPTDCKTHHHHVISSNALTGSSFSQLPMRIHLWPSSSLSDDENASLLHVHGLKYCGPCELALRQHGATATASGSSGEGSGTGARIHIGRNIKPVACTALVKVSHLVPSCLPCHCICSADGPRYNYPKLTGVLRMPWTA